MTACFLIKEKRRGWIQMGGDEGETRSRGRGKHNQIYHIKKSIFNKTIYIYNKDIFYLDSLFRDLKKKMSHLKYSL